MPKFLKGNYQVSDKGKTGASKKKQSKSLTDKLEERALAKLGGSMCFVVKGGQFVWSGDESEKTSS